MVDLKDQAQQLLPEVKNHLEMTWNDPADDQKVIGWIMSGIMFLDKKRGAPVDYTEPSDDRTLLFEYTRYMRDSAREVFEENYRSELLAMQNERRVKAYAEKTISQEQ